MQRYAYTDPAIQPLLGSAWSRFARLVDQAQAGARAFYQSRLGLDLSIEAAVQHIIDDVAERGDAAVAHYNKLFDGIEQDVPALRFDADDCRAAFERIEPSLQEA